MNTPTPSAQAVEEMLDACRLRIVELQAEMEMIRGGIHEPVVQVGPRRGPMYNESLRLLSEEFGLVARHLRLLSEEFGRLVLRKEALLADIQRNAQATSSVQDVEQLLEACSLRLIEVQAEIQKFWDWIHSPMGQVGPERRRIYEDQIRALSEESDRLALSREGLLAELRRITPADR